MLKILISSWACRTNLGSPFYPHLNPEDESPMVKVLTSSLTWPCIELQNDLQVSQQFLSDIYNIYIIYKIYFNIYNI